MKKHLSAFILGCFSFTTLAAPWVEASFWEERKSVVQRLQAKNKVVSDCPVQSDLSFQMPLFLAQLPQTRHLNFDLGHTSAGSGVHTADHQSRGMPPQSFSASNDISAGFSSSILPYGSIRHIHLSKNKNAPFIIHIQDAHGIIEAQKNIASMIQALQKSQGISVVGVEGAVNGFNLAPYRNFPDSSLTKKVAEHFLAQGHITGAEYAGLTAHTLPLLWGVEDKTLYENNIKAFQDSLTLKSTVSDIIDKNIVEANSLKKEIYSQALKKFDKHFNAYHSRKDTLVSYVEYLANKARNQFASSKKMTHLHMFMQALKKEKTLDFKTVEKERAELVQIMAHKLSHAQITDMVHHSANYRSGYMGYGAYYEYLRNLCHNTGIKLTKFKQLQVYMSYVLLAEKINKNKLLDELMFLEQTVQYSLAKTQEQKGLVRISKNLNLLNKLIHHQMTPANWAYYQDNRKNILQVVSDIEDLSFALSNRDNAGKKPAEDLLENLISPYEDFCHYAVKRNAAFIRHLQKKMQQEQTRTAMLITGGFHSEGLAQLMQDQDMSYMVITPQITKIPQNQNYLDVFARDPLPLEKMLSGETIFMAHPLSLAHTWPSGLVKKGTINEQFMSYLIAVHASLKQGYQTLISENIKKAGLKIRAIEIEVKEKIKTVVLSVKEKMFQFTVTEHTGQQLVTAKEIPRYSWLNLEIVEKMDFLKKIRPFSIGTFRPSDNNDLQFLDKSRKTLALIFQTLKNKDITAIHRKLKNVSTKYKAAAKGIRKAKHIKKLWTRLTSKTFLLSAGQNTDLQKGDQIDGYIVQEKIGVGGYGTVYLARDKNNQTVVIKTIGEYLGLYSSIEKLAILTIEGRSLESANKMELSESPIPAFISQGTGYLIMEHIKGITLDHKVGLMTLNEAVQILEQIKILHETLGLIHNDLKPSNIMLMTDDNGLGCGIKILDLGSATQIKKNNNKIGRMFRSPTFCAPEAFSHEGTVKSDVYSFAMILKTLLHPDVFEACPDLEALVNRIAPSRGDQSLKEMMESKRQSPGCDPQDRPSVDEFLDVLKKEQKKQRKIRQNISIEYLMAVEEVKTREELEQFLLGLISTLSPDTAKSAVQLLSVLKKDQLTSQEKEEIEQIFGEELADLINEKLDIFHSYTPLKEHFPKNEETARLPHVPQPEQARLQASVFINHYGRGKPGFLYWLGHPRIAPLWEWMFQIPSLIFYLSGMEPFWLLCSVLTLSLGFGFLHRTDQQGNPVSFEKKLILSGVGIVLNMVMLMPVFLVSSVFWGVMVGMGANILLHYLLNVSGLLFSSPIRVPRALEQVDIKTKDIAFQDKLTIINEYMMGMAPTSKPVQFDITIGRPITPKGQWKKFSEQSLEKFDPIINTGNRELLSQINASDAAGFGKALKLARENPSFRRLIAYVLLEKIQQVEKNEYASYVYQKTLNLMALLHAADSSLFAELKGHKDILHCQKKDFDLLVNLASTLFYQGKSAEKAAFRMDRYFEFLYDSVRHHAVRYCSSKDMISSAMNMSNKLLVFDVSDLSNENIGKAQRDEMIQKINKLKDELDDEFDQRVILVSKNKKIDLSVLFLADHVVTPNSSPEFFTKNKFSLFCFAKHCQEKNMAQSIDVLTLNQDNIDQTGIDDMEEFVRVMVLLAEGWIKDVSAHLINALKKVRFTKVQA